MYFTSNLPFHSPAYLRHFSFFYICSRCSPNYRASNSTTFSSPNCRMVQSPCRFIYKLPASAAVIFLFFLCVFLILSWELTIKVISIFFRRFLSNGNRGKKWKSFFIGFQNFIISFNLAIFIGLLSLFLWSFARVWRFPSILPTEWTTRNWLRDTDLLLELFCSSLFIGFVTSFISIVLVILCLERELLSSKKLSSKGLFLIYLYLSTFPQLCLESQTRAKLHKNRLSKPIFVARLKLIIKF